MKPWMTLLGILGFICFFIADFNDRKMHEKLLSWSFSCGAVMLAAAVLLQLSFLQDTVLHGFWLIALILLLSAGCFIMLIKCLFFSFPASDAYCEPGKIRPVYDKEMYGICRHPGFWWMLFLMIGLSLIAEFPVSSLVIYTICNLLLILYEDRIVFPEILSGYEQYKKRVPFLIPALSRKRSFKRGEQR